MKEIMKRLSEMGNDRVKFVDDNAIQLLTEQGSLIIAKNREEKYTTISIMHGETREEVLKIIEEYK